MKKTSNKGFTLIEMLVVIAIIAILTGIIVSNLAGSKAKARDAKRISDMGNIQLALELVFDRCNAYPPVGANGGVNLTATVCSKNVHDYNMSDFMSAIPVPTQEKSQSVYEYAVNTGATDYVLHAILESPNAAAKNGLTAAPSWSSVTCSNSDTSTDYCVGPK